MDGRRILSCFSEERAGTGILQCVLIGETRNYFESAKGSGSRRARSSVYVGLSAAVRTTSTVRTSWKGTIVQ